MPDNANTCDAPVAAYSAFTCADNADLSPSVMAAATAAASIFIW